MLGPMAPSDHTGIRQVIGERLLIERRRQGRSQIEVAAAMGVDPKLVSNAEHGRASLESQFRIAAELGVELLAAAS